MEKIECNGFLVVGLALRREHLVATESKWNKRKRIKTKFWDITIINECHSALDG